MEFSKQEYWSGLPIPSPGDLPNLGIEHGPPALQVDSLPSEPPGKLSEKVRHKMLYIYFYDFTLEDIVERFSYKSSSPNLLLGTLCVCVCVCVCYLVGLGWVWVTTQKNKRIGEWGSIKFSSVQPITRVRLFATL